MDGGGDIDGGREKCYVWTVVWRGDDRWGCGLRPVGVYDSGVG